MISIFFNGFWSGFHDHTNAVNDKFFIELMKQVYNEDVTVTFNIDEANVLIENTQIARSFREYKEWRHTYLFSGESYIHADKDKYSCVLYGQRCHKNVINCPLYIPYIYSSYTENILTNSIDHRTDVPKKDILVIISNPSGHMRNAIIEKLGSKFNITFAGNYKNNIGGALPYYYNSKEFLDYVKEFKYILAMENSEEDTYITEKIMHGILAQTIPIYWGSKQVSRYFNKDRFFEITDENSINSVIRKIQLMSDEDWLLTVNKPIFTEFGQNFNINKMAKYIRNLIFSRKWQQLDHTYVLCNNEFEPARFNRLQKMFEDISLSINNYTFISPTYKHLITDEMMEQLVQVNIVQTVRRLPMKKAEISLFLNFKAVFEEICYMFKDGNFLVLESDAINLPSIESFNECLTALHGKLWSGINLGGDKFNPNDFKYCNCDLPYRKIHQLDIDKINQNSIEDLSSPTDSLRFIRKFHTRCTDSQLFSYKGCETILNYMNTETNYGAPYDYYLTNLFENNMDFKYYWTTISYFIQASNLGLDQTTIQNDTI